MFKSTLILLTGILFFYHLNAYGKIENSDMFKRFEEGIPNQNNSTTGYLIINQRAKQDAWRRNCGNATSCLTFENERPYKQPFKEPSILREHR